MPQEPKYIEHFEGPVSALVIGISKYKHGKAIEQGLDLDEAEFPNLRYAADDAQKFFNFLQQKGVSDVTLLKDEKATLTEIKKGLINLRQYCEGVKQYYDNGGDDKKEPLVIVFFSGHGWADNESNHYIVPHDAERNGLEATALSNSLFKDTLQKIKTKKLVVFLDACHAGAMALQNSKGNNTAYDFKKDLDDLGEGEGRFIISSCKPEQKSWESEEFHSGIFTYHLLRLLACEEKEVLDQIPQEEIDVFTLYNVLESEVKRTSWDAYKEKQEPQINTEQGSKFIIAINKQKRQQRVKNESDDYQNKLEFLNKVCEAIELSSCEFPGKLQDDLRDHVANKTKDKKELKVFYRCFDENYKLWAQSGKTSEILKEECCPRLIEHYEKYIAARLASVSDLRSSPATEKPAEAVTDATASTVTNETKQSELVAPVDVMVSAEKNPAQVTAPMPLTDEKKENMSSQVVQILQPLSGSDYAPEMMKLFKCLGQPVNEAEVEACIQDIKNGNPAPGLHQALAEVMKNFKEQSQQLKNRAPSFSNMASLRTS